MLWLDWMRAVASGRATVDAQCDLNQATFSNTAPIRLESTDTFQRATIIASCPAASPPPLHAPFHTLTAAADPVDFIVLATSIISGHQLLQSLSAEGDGA